MPELFNRVINAHNQVVDIVLSTVCKKETTREYLSELKASREFSHALNLVKLLAPIALAAIAAYFCPVTTSLNAIKYMIKGAVFLGTYLVSLPLLGGLCRFAKAGSPDGLSSCGYGTAVPRTTIIEAVIPDLQPKTPPSN